MNHLYYNFFLFIFAFFLSVSMIIYNPAEMSFFDLYLKKGIWKSFLGSSFLQNIPALFFSLYGIAAYIIPILFFGYVIFDYLGGKKSKIRIFSGSILIHLFSLLATLKKVSFAFPFLPGGFFGSYWMSYLPSNNPHIFYLILFFVIFFGFLFLQKEGVIALFFLLKKIDTIFSISNFFYSLYCSVISWIFYFIPFFKKITKNRYPLVSLIDQLIDQELKKEYQLLSDFYPISNQEAVLENNNLFNIEEEGTSSIDTILYKSPSEIFPNSNFIQPKYVEDVMEKELIESFFKEFGILLYVEKIITGPNVSTYFCTVPLSVRSSSIENLLVDLGRVIGKNNVLMEEATPNKNSLCLIIPLQKKELISLASILNRIENNYYIPMALGLSTEGLPVIEDLVEAPHLLIAGATGSGKSILMHAIITTILWKKKPSEIKLILVDPKQLEFSFYKEVPHLLIPIINDISILPNILDDLLDTMNKRYKELSLLGVRSINEYNEKIKIQESKLMEYIVVIIDEYADIKLQMNFDVEKKIIRLCQMGRASGIHIIIATQRPSVDILSGLLKANIPSRISLKVASKIDSRVILDRDGAENLLGRGDMLFLHSMGELKRVHGAFITLKEIEEVVLLITKQKKYRNDILK